MKFLTVLPSMPKGEIVGIGMMTGGSGMVITDQSLRDVIERLSLMAITQERWQSCMKAQADDDDKQMINGHQLRYEDWWIAGAQVENEIYAG